MKRTTAIAAALLSCGFVLAHAQSAPHTHLIVPGKSVGPISLGERRADALRHLPPPTNGDSPWGEIGSGIVSDDWDNLSIVSKNGRIIQIEITDARYRTADGVSAQSTVAQVRRRFARVKSIFYPSNGAARPEVTRYYSAAQGIAFDYEDARSGRIEDILIYPPGAAPKMYGAM